MTYSILRKLYIQSIKREKKGSTETYPLPPILSPNRGTEKQNNHLIGNYVFLKGF